MQAILEGLSPVEVEILVRDGGIHRTVKHQSAGILREELGIGVAQFSAIGKAEVIQGLLP